MEQKHSELHRNIESSDQINSDLIKLFKLGKYSDLIDRARSSEAATELGLRFSPSPWTLIIDREFNPEEIRARLNMIGAQSKVDFGRLYEGHHVPIIDIGTYYVTNPKLKLPAAFLQGVAEIHLEEWIHVGQELRIASGQSWSLSGLTDDMEIDVAAYLAQQGVELSEYFLDRNGRRSFLKEKELIK